MERFRIIHPHDLYKGKIGYLVERIEQHSLYTYVLTFPDSCNGHRRAYQRHEIKFLKAVKAMPKPKNNLQPCTQ